MIRFIDRERELDLLERGFRSGRPGLFILYGRRRIGKSRLVLEFLRGKPGVYYLAEDVHPRLQIRELQQKMAEVLQDSFLQSTELQQWHQLFTYLQKVLPRTEPWVLTLDEFTYLVKNDRSILGALQRFWDEFAQHTRLMILLTGSLLGTMQEEVLSHASPLFGRRTRDLLLQPLALRHALRFLPQQGMEDALSTVMVLGGIPEYLLKAAGYAAFSEFIRQEFLDPYGYFYREPYFLLSQEFREIRTYFSLLSAIAGGYTRPNEIATYVGIEARNLYPYLEALRNLGFIAKLPTWPRKPRKNVFYLLQDPMLDFWFNFVYPYREQIERRSLRQIPLNRIRTFLGKRFEHLVRENLSDLIGTDFHQVGKWVDRDEDVDVVAFQEDTRLLLLGECKWRSGVGVFATLRALRQRAPRVPFWNQAREVRYLLVAKSFRPFSQPLPGDVILLDLEGIWRRLRA